MVGQRRDWLLIGLSTLGTALALVATVQTLQLQVDASRALLCGSSTWFDCRTAHASSFSHFLGIPIAWYGVLLFFWVTVALACGEALGLSRDAVRFTCRITLLGALPVCAAEAYAMLFLLRVVCPLCVSIDLVVLLLFLGLATGRRQAGVGIIKYWRGFRERAASGPSLKAQGDIRWCFGSLLMLFATGLVAMSVVSNVVFRVGKVDVAREAREHFLQAPTRLVVPGDAPSWGSPGATVEIVVASDFLCPICKESGLVLRGLLAEYAGSTRLRFLNYPLSTQVNPYVKHDIHPLAGMAASAALSAQKMGGFWSFHDEMFRNQSGISKQRILDLATHRGWDAGKFWEEMGSPRTSNRLRQDIEAAHSAGVLGTPTVWVNGRVVRRWSTPPLLRRILDAELDRRGSSATGRPRQAARRPTGPEHPPFSFSAAGTEAGMRPRMVEIHTLRREPPVPGGTMRRR
ncbi:MAG: thioredoxin domain-containing protein [Candidatus Eisenbacteria bacterium]|nr:thioredoxin domain-containing protein [Candidatus Eisenbacteria bacterium]